MIALWSTNDLTLGISKPINPPSLAQRTMSASMATQMVCNWLSETQQGLKVELEGGEQAMDGHRMQAYTATSFPGREIEEGRRLGLAN
jgi:hypothetical protein